MKTIRKMSTSLPEYIMEWPCLIAMGMGQVNFKETINNNRDICRLCRGLTRKDDSRHIFHILMECKHYKLERNNAWAEARDILEDNQLLKLIYGYARISKLDKKIDEQRKLVSEQYEKMHAEGLDYVDEKIRNAFKCMIGDPTNQCTTNLLEGIIEQLLGVTLSEFTAALWRGDVADRNMALRFIGSRNGNEHLRWLLSLDYFTLRSATKIYEEQLAARQFLTADVSTLADVLINNCTTPDVAMAILSPDKGVMYNTCVLTTAVNLIKHIMGGRRLEKAQIHLDSRKYRYM